MWCSRMKKLRFHFTEGTERAESSICHSRLIPACSSLVASSLSTNTIFVLSAQASGTGSPCSMSWPLSGDQKVFIAGGQWQRLTRSDVLGPFIHDGWIDPSSTVNYYNGAKIVINVHRTCENGEDNRNTHHLQGRSINPRTYEISACGTMQITDARGDLPRFYQPGYDIETFTTAAELESKIKYYLKHEQERQAMAWRGC